MSSRTPAVAEHRRRLLLFLAAAVLAVAAACGGSEPTAATVEQVTFADTLHINLSQFTRLDSGLYVRDTLVGTGPAAAVGDTLTLQYVGRLPSGLQFGRNASPDEPLVMVLGDGRYIRGWELGLVGMQVGSHRQLIVPPALAYGSAGAAGVPPGSVLLFDVDLLSLK